MNERFAWAPTGAIGSDARPVGDAPVAPLVAAADGLAKRWLITLIAGAPLLDATRIPLADLAREGPSLCAVLARALASDVELARLARGGELAGLAAGAGRLAGARDPVEAVAAVDALRAVLWSALLDELREPGAAQVAELAARLARVCSVVTQSAVAALQTAEAAGGGAPVELEREEPWIVASRGASVGDGAGGADAPRGDVPEAPELVVADAGAAFAGEASGTSGGEGPAAWISSIGRRLERFEEDRRPFAVLLIEVADLHRLGQAQAPETLADAIGAIERALSSELRPADQLAREGPGRYWLVTPETDADAAIALADRLAAAVSERGAAHRGAPLRVVIGTAVCPDDGREPAALAAAADVGLYAARAAGLPVAPRR